MRAESKPSQRSSKLPFLDRFEPKLGVTIVCDWLPECRVEGTKFKSAFHILPAMPLIVPGVTKANSRAQEISDRFIPALVVVDMQTDFVTGSLAVPDAKSIVETINSILALPFVLKVGTKDFHPPARSLCPIYTRIRIYRRVE
jgi:hypothetical protein